MKEKAEVFFGVLMIIFVVLCLGYIVYSMFFTHNSSIRMWGGNDTILVEKGYKVNMVTWKQNNDLWILTEPMDSTYIPKVKEFKESSNLGVFEGNIVFIESK